MFLVQNISYECIGPNTYVVTLTVLEDCGTAFIGNVPQPISVNNSCGLTFGTNISFAGITYQQEISQVCSQLITQTTCNGGVSQEYMHRWRDTITLPGSCDSWIFSYYDDCCRNT